MCLVNYIITFAKVAAVRETPPPPLDGGPGRLAMPGCLSGPESDVKADLSLMSGAGVPSCGAEAVRPTGGPLTRTLPRPTENPGAFSDAEKC